MSQPPACTPLETIGLNELPASALIRRVIAAAGMAARPADPHRPSADPLAGDLDELATVIVQVTGSTQIPRSPMLS